jgi:hypothetical protein
MRKPLLASLVIASALLAGAASTAVPNDDGKPEIEVYIIEPRDGAAVTNPVRVVFGLRGMGVAPAGVNAVNTGHHHLLIDTDLPRLDQPIPTGNKNIRHFNGGQTETQLILLPGSHTLQLQLGDYGHMSYMPPLVSPKITITVKP